MMILTFLGFPLIKGFCEMLVSEDRIQTDKIGSSTYFWAFPSAKSQRLKRKREQLDQQEEELQQKIRKLEKELQEVKTGKEDSDERIEKMDEKKTLSDEIKELDSELAKYREFDPDVLEEIKNETEKCMEATERWTNNIFQTQSFWTKVLFKDIQEYNKVFSWIPEDLDFLQ